MRDGRVVEEGPARQVIESPTQQIYIRAINNLYLHRVILFFYTFVSKEQYFKPQR
jgi:ABC-type proline/glycine betaine transport system ATPase subunit